MGWQGENISQRWASIRFIPGIRKCTSKLKVRGLWLSWINLENLVWIALKHQHFPLKLKLLKGQNHDKSNLEKVIPGKKDLYTNFNFEYWGLSKGIKTVTRVKQGNEALCCKMQRIALNSPEFVSLRLLSTVYCSWMWGGSIWREKLKSQLIPVWPIEGCNSWPQLCHDECMSCSGKVRVIYLHEAVNDDPLQWQKKIRT
jgi:hypothetical protein